MMTVMLLTAACFVAAMLNLALDTRVKDRVMGLSAFVAVVTGIADGAGSAAFYEELDRNAPSAILLCTSSRKENEELGQEIERFYDVRKDQPPVVRCAPDGVMIGDDEYRLEDVDIRAMDRRAMVINHVYCGGPSAEADWRSCNPFSRASSRASAEFAPAFAYIAGRDPLADWPPPPEVLENLGRTEHLRWCAFHLAMGYRPMNRAEFDARAARYRAGEKLCVGKNVEGMTHACLVPWEELDALSERESAVIGRPLDYKAMDIDNVRAIPELMRGADE